MQGHPAVSTKFTRPTVLSNWLANKSRSVRNHARQVFRAGSGEPDGHRDWIEPLETREALGISESALVIGHHLPLSDAKLYRFLLDVVSAAQRAHPRVRLLLVADGVWRAAMEDQAAAMGLRKLVVFTSTGFDPSRLLQAVDVLAFPAAAPGLGTAIAEAANAGVPCVVSTDVKRESAEEWAAMLLERAAQPRTLTAKDYSPTDLERLSAIYRTT
jgi:glycosyltransferase involved in cell wall biosynthesis